jgi:hypothetical protein
MDLADDPHNQSAGQCKERRFNQAIRSSFSNPGDIQKGARTSDKSDAVTPARVPPQSEARMIAGKKVRKGIEVPTKRKRSARTRAAAKAAASPNQKKLESAPSLT